jgi:hypothetical protein
MAQVTIYMDDETVGRMRDAATQAGVSMSAWLARLVQERTRRIWPADVAALAGAWDDFPSLETLRADMVADVPREDL